MVRIKIDLVSKFSVVCQRLTVVLPHEDVSSAVNPLGMYDVRDDNNELHRAFVSFMGFCDDLPVFLMNS